MYIVHTLCKYQYFHEEKTNRIFKTHLCPLYGTQSGHSGSIEMKTTSESIRLFMVHMTWSTVSRTSPPPRGGFSQHLPIFAWNMPVFSQAQYLHVGMMGVHPHGSEPHFNQFKVRDWNNGRGLKFLLSNLFYLGLSFWHQKSHGRIHEMKFRRWFHFINFFWAIQWCESLFCASRKNG